MSISIMPTLLTFALPLAKSYAEEQEALVLREGLPLSTTQIFDAKLAGVQHPHLVRMLQVPQIPLPTHPVLARANSYTNVIGPHSSRMTYGHAIYLRTDCWLDRASLVHELIHVAQTERLGGIQEFLEAYLRECLTVGHDKSPMELEAVNLTRKICG